MDATLSPEVDADDAARGRRLGGGVLAAFVAVLAALWIDVHSWESSLYASSAEGFVQLAQLFAEPGGRALPDLSLFHPYHPLFHATARALYVVVGRPLGIGALELTVVMNKAAAVAAVVLGHRVLRRAGADATSSLVAITFVASSKAFLFASFDGEAHLVSLAFFLAALERTFAALERPAATSMTAALGAAWWPALLLSTGAAFNVAVAFYGLVPAAVLLRVRRWRELVAALVFAGVVLVAVFVAVPFVLFSLTSFDDYRRLVGLYADLPRPQLPMGERLDDALASIGAGLVAGVDTGGIVAARVVVGVVVGAGLTFAVARQQFGRWFFAAFWIVGFVVGEMLLNAARSVNGTIYVMLALGCFVGVSFDTVSRQLRVLVCVALIVFGVHNVRAVVVAKCFTDGRYASPLAALAGTPTGDALRGRPIAVFVDHMAVFGDVYALGHDVGARDVTIFVSMLHKSSDAFAEYLQAHGTEPVCILSSRPLRLPVDVVVEKRVEMAPDVYHFSVNHPEAQRPVNKITWLGCRGLPSARRR